MDEKTAYITGKTSKTSKTSKYVVAVSGGVDSVVLLHILAQRLPSDRLVVAHFDHGIRPDSADDQEFVGRLARMHGLTYLSDEGRLGPDTSEAVARDARYVFLRRARQENGADYIVTAHHEDDVLETAVLNLLRGTGRKGLSALRSHGDLYRPLLSTPKQHIRQYAVRNRLQWHEDSTNGSPDYLRNYIRMNIMPKFDAAARIRLRELIATARDMNIEIDSLLAEQLHLQPQGDGLDRHWFTMLPHSVSLEVIAAWLRRLGVADFDRRLLDRVTIAAKTLESGKQVDINGRYVMAVQKYSLSLLARPR